MYRPVQVTRHTCTGDSWDSHVNSRQGPTPPDSRLQPQGRTETEINYFIRIIVFIVSTITVRLIDVQVAVSDFNESARMSSQQIKSDLSEMSRITNFVKENKTRTSQTLKNPRNFNHTAKDDPHDEDFEKVKNEFNLLNKNFFQCLESHR